MPCDRLASEQQAMRVDMASPRLSMPRGALRLVGPSLLTNASSQPTGTVTLPESVEMVMPGDNVTANFELITPVALEPGLRFAVREGSRTVAAGVVTQAM